MSTEVDDDDSVTDLRGFADRVRDNQRKPM